MLVGDELERFNSAGGGEDVEVIFQLETNRVQNPRLVVYSEDDWSCRVSHAVSFVQATGKSGALAMVADRVTKSMHSDTRARVAPTRRLRFSRRTTLTEMKLLS